jgi:sulfate permease, SulP family
VLGVPQEDGDFFVFQAYPAGGGLSQTAVNRETGARTQLAGIVTALVVVLTLLFLTPPVRGPAPGHPGAVVIVAVVGLVGLVDLAALRRLRRIRFRDHGLALVALAAVLVLGVLEGVLLAVVVSMLTLIHGVNHPPIEVLGRRPGSGHWRGLDRHPDGETVPGMLVLRPVTPIYFANAPRLRRRLLELVDACDPPPRVLVLDLDAVPDIDVTALDLLPSFDADLRERSITLWLANPNDRPLDMLRRLPDTDAWERRLFGDLDAAAAHSSSSGDEPRPGRPPR